MIMKSFTFFAESGEGKYGTDYRIAVYEDCDGVVTVEESHCGRSRGCFWTEPEIVFEGGNFWLTVQNYIRNWGGWSEISDQRIGEVDRW